MIQTMKLSRFRRYNQETFTFHPRLNIILGDNAQGKTTVLEAIHLLGLTKSHRQAKDEDLIQNQAESAEIYAQGVLFDRKVSFSVVLSKNGKRVKYNQTNITKLSDYIGRLNVVMFSPEDLDLIKGGPQERRRFMDLEIGQLKKGYIYHLNHYRRLLKERNDVLKSLAKETKYDQTMLDIITEQLGEHGDSIDQERVRFVEALNQKITKLMPLLGQAQPEVNLMYEMSAKGSLAKAIKKKQSADLLTGTTSLGPHRNDLEFFLAKEPLKYFASQGQIRTLALALKWAVAEIIYDQKAVRPIVLLDDVFSELDRTRQTLLLKKLQGDNQIFITATHLPKNHQVFLGDHKIIHIEAGKIKGVDGHG